MECISDIYGIRDHQLRVLEILQFLDRVCRQNGLTYYLAYGTLLGAVRHKGFIPWDDDVDVWMKREDYMKLLDYLRTDNKDTRFVLNEGAYKPKGDRPAEFQMRILDLSGRIERSYAGTSLEVYRWIDIFALDSFPSERKEQYFKTFKRNLFLYKVARCKNFVIQQKSFFGRMNKLIYTLHQKFKLFFFMDEEKCCKKVVRSLTKYQNVDSPECFCYAAVYLPKPEKCFFASEWFASAAELEFEGLKFYVPADCHNVLTRLYGNYMELPPEDQRRPTHGSDA